MRKAEKIFSKELALNEYILVLKYFMKNKQVAHVSGLCNSPFLSADVSEEELSDIFRNAYKHKILVKKEDSICIHPEIFSFMNAWTHSVNIIAMQKPSYQGEKLIAIGRATGCYLATVQNAKKNSILLLADKSLEKLYDKLETYITEKDINRAFKLKKVNQSLADNHINDIFTVNHIFQLIVLCVDNSTGCKSGDDLTINAGKNEYEIIRGSIKNNAIEKKEIGQLRQELLAYIENNCPEPPKNEEDEERKKEDQKQEYEDPETYTSLSYQKLIHMEGYPLSRLELLKFQFRNIVNSFRDWKRILKILGIYILIAFIVVVWNMFGMCYLNDTFRMDRRAFWGDATAYLFAGIVGYGSGLKGFSFVKDTINTTFLAASFYFLLTISIKSLWNDFSHRKMGENLKGIVELAPKVKLYSKVVDRKLSSYLWGGLAIASIIGMILWNPFTIFLLSLMLLFSCAKCERGLISPVIMMYRTSTDYQKVQVGKKKCPLFANIQLWLFSLGLGFLFNSVVNLIIWFLFDYNLWARLIFSTLFVLIALLKLGIIKINKPSKVFSVIFVCVIAGGLLWFSHYGMVFADDGGWTESGGSLLGLFQNSGFATILAYSLLMGATTVCALAFFGVGSAIIVPVALGVSGVSAIWSSTTEQGKKTANDLILGKYSPYGGDDTIASVLNFTIGVVPGIGDVFSVCTATRDAQYSFENGDILSGIFNAGCGVMGLKGCGDDIVEAFGKSMLNEGTEGAAKSAISRVDDLLERAIDNSKQSAEGGIVGMVDEQIKNAINDQYDGFNGKTITKSHYENTSKSSGTKYTEGGKTNSFHADSYDPEKPFMNAGGFNSIIEEASEEQIQEIIEIMNNGAIQMDDTLSQIMQDINEYIDNNPTEMMTKEIILQLLSQYMG